MEQKKNRERYEAAGKRALMLLTRCRRLFKGDGLYIPAKVVDESVEGTKMVVGWFPGQGFCCDIGDGDLVVANNPLDAPRLAAVLSAMPKLYSEAKRLRNLHSELLENGSSEAETFLEEATSQRLPPKEPPKWP